MTTPIHHQTLGWTVAAVYREGGALGVRYDHDARIRVPMVPCDSGIPSCVALAWPLVWVNERRVTV